MASKISASILTFNSEATIKALLESIKGHVDEIVVVDSDSTDKTTEICLEYGCRVHVREWNHHFADARNEAFSKCTGDWIIWLDSDDVVVKGENIRKVVERLEKEKKICAKIPYRYQFNKEGNCTILQDRERVLKAGHFKWVRAVHEIAIPIRKGGRFVDTSFWLDHHPHDTKENLLRNVKILENCIRTDPQYDTLDLYYLGKHYFTMGDKKRCVTCLHKFIERSQKSHFVYQTLMLLGIVYALENVQKGLDYFFKAVQYQPDWQEAYYNAGYFLIDIDENEKGMYWINEGLRRQENLPPYTYNPMGIFFQPYWHLGRAWNKLNKVDEALDCYKKALDYAEDKKTREMVEALEDIKKVNEDAEKISDLKDYIDFSKLPKKLIDHPLIESLMPDYNKPGGIAFMCGHNWEDWGPQSQESGIGGSEEALIEITRELARLGREVIVYTNCIKPGVYDDVTWKDYRTFPMERPFDYVVFWRSPALLDYPTKAKKIYIWHQDVIEKNAYTIDRLKTVNKIIVLSKWHRSNAPDVPDDKFYLTRNGFMFKERKGKLPIARKMHHFISMSSYDRGLQWTLEAWEKIKKAIPDAVLHICYGWDTFDRAHSENPEQMRWKTFMMDLFHQDGIEHHGRISHEELEKLIYACQYWIYSSTFMETSCISGIKAQAFGAIPLTNKLAALDETVEWGHKIDANFIRQGDKDMFFEEVIKIVKQPNKVDTEAMMKATREHYDYRLIASEWNQDLFGGNNGKKIKVGLSSVCQANV